MKEQKQGIQQTLLGGLTPELQAQGRKLGQEANALNGRGRRMMWREFAIKAVNDNYDLGQHVFRDGLVRAIHADCVLYGIKGKAGGNIKTDTISRWLSAEVEQEIRLEAARQLIERARTNWK